MAARTGKEFLERLRTRKPRLWLEGERVDAVNHLRNTDRSRAYALVDAILGSAS